MCAAGSRSEHVESAHTEAELGLLLQRARERLDNPAQGVLELGIEPMPPVKGLIAPAETGLFEAASVVTPAGRDAWSARTRGSLSAPG